jgi:hypothetical protein
VSDTYHSDKNIYFANLPTDKVGDELIKIKDAYYSHLEKLGHFTLLKHAHLTYYKASYVNGRIRRTGENLEYIEISVNHYRNLIQHSLSFVTSQRPQFEPKAANTDYKSIAQTQLATNLLEYYMRAQKMERYIKDATEWAINYGEGWVYVGWNATSGKQYGTTESGSPIYEGDVELDLFSPLDVIRDPTKPEGKRSYLMIRRYKNRHDLVAKYPELAERLIAVQTDRYEDMRFSFRELKEERRDDIPVYTFFHDRTEAVPDGRIVEFVDSDIVLNDGPLPYREIPVYRITPSEKQGSIFGYSNAWDLLAPQQAMDKLHSTVVTNQGTFGVQNIGVPKGADLNVTQLAGGLNLIEFDPKSGPPVPIQLCSTPPEIFSYIGMLEKTMETLMGVNSVARGNPETSLKSGSALALVQAQAIQFSQGLQQSYAQLLEDVGTAVINLLIDYATVPRIALISGISNRSRLQQFKGDDIAQISRVLVDMGNPLMRTTAGRVNIAEQLVQAGLVTDAKQYLQVITTGRLEPIYEGPVAELNLIRAENEKLADGKVCPVLQTDDHGLHMQEHKQVLSSPEAREQPNIIQATLGHMQQHMGFMQPMMPPPMAPGALDKPGAVGATMNPTNKVTEKAGAVKQPQLPKPAGE